MLTEQLADKEKSCNFAPAFGSRHVIKREQSENL